MSQIRQDNMKALASKKAKKASQFNIVHFFGHIKEEFKKIAWMPKDELITHTKIVIASIFALGALLFGMDIIIKGTLLGISTLIKWVTG